MVICAPRSISLRVINKATSLFGTFTSIQTLESNPSAESHQYFEALFQGLGSSILAHQEKVQGITFTSGSPNPLKNQNIIDSIVKDHATCKWEATLLAAKEFGYEKQLRSINERLIVAKPQRLPTHPHSFSHPLLNVFTMSLLRDTDSPRPHYFQYQRYDLFIRLLVLEAISSNHSRSIISQGIVPRIEKKCEHTGMYTLLTMLPACRADFIHSSTVCQDFDSSEPQSGTQLHAQCHSTL